MEKQETSYGHSVGMGGDDTRVRSVNVSPVNVNRTQRLQFGTRRNQYRRIGGTSVSASWGAGSSLLNRRAIVPARAWAVGVPGWARRPRARWKAGLIERARLRTGQDLRQSQANASTLPRRQARSDPYRQALANSAVLRVETLAWILRRPSWHSAPSLGELQGGGPRLGVGGPSGCEN